MTCAATIQIVRHGPCADTQRLTDKSVHPDRYDHAPTISHGQSGDGAPGIIESRCRKMQFRSNETRKRFLSVHAILSRGR